MHFIWKFIRFFLVLIGLVVVAVVGLGVWAFQRGDTSMPDGMILAYTFNGTPQDMPAAPGWIAQFAPVEPTLAEVTGGITHAAADPRVSALAVQINAGDYDWADVQELQAAIQVFRDAGKKTYAYAESYGDLYPGMAEYYLASSFDEIWLQPMGSVSITGFQADVPYVKNVLAKLGINPEITQRGEYKTAPESLLLDHMSDQQRETLHSIMSSMMTDFFDGVSRARELPAARIGQLIDGAPYTADEAKERNLVDVVGYKDQLIEKLNPGGNKDDERRVNLIDYYYSVSDNLIRRMERKEEHRLGKKLGNNKSVALIYVSGMIVPGSDEMAGPFGSEAAYADDIAWDITEATDSKDVGAIVVRVDSPGGSPSASETIRRAVEVAREKGKYVVVSMGSEAASGGYWVSVDADRIYALPGTLTGSIGVFGGKPDLSAMWTKLDVNWDSVKLGANAGMWSPNRPYDPEGQAAVGRMMDDIYNGFIARVAKGRKFSPEVVEGMAEGRVWTGRQAKEHGLVDELGTLDTALADVASHLGVTRDELDIYVLPGQPNPVEQFMGFFGASAKVLDALKPWIGALSRAQNPSFGVLYQDNPLP